MAFTVIFATTKACPNGDVVGGWLNALGEAYEGEGVHEIQLRALPVRFLLATDGGPLRARVDITSTVPLARLVNLLFAVSVEAGADVRMAGEPELTRANLWLSMADEQDRLRIAGALERAAEQGQDLTRRLWELIAAVRPGCDDRWDAERKQVVQLLEVGSVDGISLEEAAWHVAEPRVGDVIGRPVKALVHSMAWRWLSDAYPGLAEQVVGP